MYCEPNLLQSLSEIFELRAWNDLSTPHGLPRRHVHRGHVVPDVAVANDGEDPHRSDKQK